MSEVVFGMVKTREIVRQSVLLPDSMRNFEHNTKAPRGAVFGVGTGGAVGGALGWLAGLGALAIPGIGPFIAAGPILAGLSGVAAGAVLGGITGGLVGSQALRGPDQVCVSRPVRD